MEFKHIFRSVSLACAVVTSVSATTVTFDSGGVACANAAAGVCTSQAGANQIDFDSASAPSPYVSGAASFSFTPGDVSPFVSGSLSSQYAAPPSDQTPYLSVGSPGRANSVIIDFDTPINYYGLYLGSPDAYNVLSFYETGNTVTPLVSFNGNDLFPPANGNQSFGDFVNFRVTGGSISRIVLSSSQAALESDNHAYVTDNPGAVPEPATMGLMGSALAGLAFFARRRLSSE